MKSNRRLKNSLLLFGCPQTQDTHLTTLLGCTRKMKCPQFASLAVITQRHQGCLGPREVCHLQLLGEQGRSKGLSEQPSLGHNFNTEHRKSLCCIHCQDRTKGKQGRTGTEEILNSAIPSALEPKRKENIWFSCLCFTYCLYFAQFIWIYSIILSHLNYTGVITCLRLRGKPLIWITEETELQELATKEQELVQPPGSVTGLGYMPKPRAELLFHMIALHSRRRTSPFR